MTEELINRINELAKKSKDVGLTEDEKQEQQKLRKEYLAEFRKGFRQNYMENMYVVDENGNERKLTSKKGDK